MNPLSMIGSIRSAAVGRQSRVLDDDELTDEGLSDRIKIKNRNHGLFGWGAFLVGVVGGASLVRHFVKGQK